LLLSTTIIKSKLLLLLLLNNRFDLAADRLELLNSLCDYFLLLSLLQLLTSGWLNMLWMGITMK